MKKLLGFDFKQVLEKLKGLKGLKELKGLKGVKQLSSSEMKSLPRHEALNPICWLEGTWKTKTPGEGKFPTMKPFLYSEEISFTSLGQPMFNYKSETWDPETKNPMHIEVGFLKIIPNTNKLSLLLAHNFGVTTIEEGEVCDKEITLKSVHVARPTEGTKPPKVVETKRHIKLLEENCFQYVFYMSTEKTELIEHLRTIYHRQ